jgi:3-hydroxyacyl-CoA dehydrogenase
MDHKVTVVGAGNVGATTAQRIAEANLADVVMVDIAADLATGKALDMMESAPILGFDARISGGGDYADRRLGRLCGHRRPGPEAGHEPRRPAGRTPTSPAASSASW